MGSGKKRASFSSTESHYSGGSSIFSGGAMSSTYTAGTSYSTSPGTNQVAGTHPTLPCEFIGYGECNWTFELDDKDSWIEHIIATHLNDQLPKKAICWFCDDYVFDYKDKYAGGDRRANFDNRMSHIHDHILYEGRTIEQMRPDHHMNKHLHETELISTQAYNYVRRTSEVAGGPWLFSHDAIPPELQRRTERSQYEYHNPREEERQRRRDRHRHGR